MAATWARAMGVLSAGAAMLVSISPAHGQPGESGGALSKPTPSADSRRAAPTEPRPRAEPRSLPEGASALDAPSPTQATATAEPTSEGEEGAPWQGPRVELGYAWYRFGDGNGGGGSHALHFGGYLPTRAARLGAYGELAVREYSLGPANDAIVRGALLAGYQHLGDLDPVVPYAVAVGTFGVLFGQRFHTPLSHTIWGAGLAFGLDVRLVKRLFAGAEFSWIRVTMDGLRYDWLMIRLRLGL